MVDRAGKALLYSNDKAPSGLLGWLMSIRNVFITSLTLANVLLNGNLNTIELPQNGSHYKSLRGGAYPA